MTYRWFLLCVSLSCVGAVRADAIFSEEESAILCAHDLLSSKMMIVNENKEEYQLAGLLLKRASECETNGEVEFYSAVLGVKQGYFEYGGGEFIALLKLSAQLGHPFAIAELYRLSDEGRMGKDNDPANYKRMFEVEVGKRGRDYPSLSQSIRITSKIFNLDK